MTYISASIFMYLPNYPPPLKKHHFQCSFEKPHAFHSGVFKKAAAFATFYQETDRNIDLDDPVSKWPWAMGIFNADHRGGSGCDGII